AMPKYFLRLDPVVRHITFGTHKLVFAAKLSRKIPPTLFAHLLARRARHSHARRQRFRRQGRLRPVNGHPHHQAHLPLIDEWNRAGIVRFIENGSGERRWVVPVVAREICGGLCARVLEDLRRAVRKRAHAENKYGSWPAHLPASLPFS